MSATKIFLSVGRTSTRQQEAFVEAFENLCKSEGLMPQTLGKTYFSSQQPLRAIADLLKKCSGTAILAYERVHLVQAIERRGSANAGLISGLNMPTVWNQIEATMAYTLGHPPLVLVEHGLKSEDLLELGYD